MRRRKQTRFRIRKYGGKTAAAPVKGQDRKGKRDTMQYDVT